MIEVTTEIICNICGASDARKVVSTSLIGNEGTRLPLGWSLGVEKGRYIHRCGACRKTK